MLEFSLKTSATPAASRRLAKAAVAIVAESVTHWDRIHELDLALTEACANVVKHAYASQGGPGDLEIRLILTPPHSIEIEVSDWGVGLDMEVDQVCDPGPTAEGGRGLFIISRLADAFDIRRDPGKNTIYFKKNIESSSWKP